MCKYIALNRGKDLTSPEGPRVGTDTREVLEGVGIFQLQFLMQEKRHQNSLCLPVGTWGRWCITIKGL